MRARSLRRFLIMLFALAGLVYGFFWWVGQQNDFQLASDTKGMIAAQQLTDSGAQAVVIDQEGKTIASSGYIAGAEDRDIAWDPQGNRVFFISDRKENSFHIFRWDPARNGVPDQKSIDKTGRSNLQFDAQTSDAKELSALVTVRGTVQEFFPKTARSVQVMPPGAKTKVTGDIEEGARSAMELIYKRFGLSFRAATWMKKRRYIAAIMRREDSGETLIVQDSELDDKGELRRPQEIFTAEKFYMTVDPASGGLVISVIDVISPLGEDGKIRKLGFKHAIFIFDPEKPQKEMLLPVALVPDDTSSFGELAVSPDGSKLLFASGPYGGDGNLNVKGLFSCPLEAGGSKASTALMQGAVSDFVFSPDGAQIAYTKREGTRRSIFIADQDGSNSRNLTGDSGDFAQPVFSPQYK